MTGLVSIDGTMDTPPIILQRGAGKPGLIHTREPHRSANRAAQARHRALSGASMQVRGNGTQHHQNHKETKNNFIIESGVADIGQT